jgi:hypothetical protein
MASATRSLPTPGLAGDERGRVGRRHARDRVEQPAHHRRGADHPGEVRLAPQRQEGRVGQGREPHRAVADRQRRARLDERLDHPDPEHPGAVGRVQIAQAVAGGLEGQLAVQRRHPAIGQGHVGRATADHDPRLRQLDHQAGVGAGHHLEPATPHLQAGRPARALDQPGTARDVVGRRGHARR